MNDLEKYFLENNSRLVQKWRHYFDIYDRHLSRFRDQEVHVVEFGVFQGGSLQMWKSYFGSKAKIYGVDINPGCKSFAEDRVQIFIGDQEDRQFLRSLATELPRIDVLIDDGGHTMNQQISTFEELFPLIDENGVYICEDLHTSYWHEYGGGYRKARTFIEHSKSLIDSLNGWHARDRSNHKVAEFTRTARSMHYYDSVLVVEKGAVEPPVNLRTGLSEIENYEPPNNFRRRVQNLMWRWF